VIPPLSDPPSFEYQKNSYRSFVSRSNSFEINDPLIWQKRETQISLTQFQTSLKNQRADD
jgi:hypothetical protein